MSLRKKGRRTTSARRPTRRQGKPAGPKWTDRIAIALAPGYFIGWREVSDFFSDLDDLLEAIVAGEPPREAAALLETLYAGLTAKMNEVHSEGEEGMFADRLATAWVTARQKGGFDADETARVLLEWSRTNPYGLLYKLADGTLAACNAASRTALGRATTDPALRKRLAALGRSTAAYLDLCEGEPSAADDCLALARIEVRRSRRAEAAAWVDRGLALLRTAGVAGCEYELRELKKVLLSKSGHAAEALELEWKEFEEAPSSWMLETLLARAPKTRRAAWSARALDAARKAGTSPFLDVATALGDADAIAAFIASVEDRELEGVSHGHVGPAAEILRKAHPREAARLFAAMGFRILVARKSRYYDAAVDNFGAARACLAAAQALDLWKPIAERVRRNHARQHGFMHRFDRMVARDPGEREPTFLESAMQAHHSRLAKRPEREDRGT